jgi:hypothetical protein
VTAQTLRAEYETVKLRDGEAIEDFTLRFTGVVQRLADLGDPEPDAKAVKKFLRVVRPRYKQLVVSMEAFVDLSQLSIEEIAGTLKSSDDADEEVTPASNSSTGKLLLTHEEWLEKCKGQDGGRGSSSSGEKKRGAPRRGRGGGAGGRGKGREGSGKGNAPARPGPDEPCHNCGRTGHWAKECRSRPRKAAQAHVGETEEEEPTLLSAVTSPDAQAGVNAPPLPQAGGSVEIHEAKVFAHLDSGERREDRSWVLDTGATNHMTGARSAFSDLDATVCGSVRFGDGSVAEIQGRGTVVFICKDGQHCALSGV